MKKLITKSGEYRLNKILSRNYPFDVFEGFDKLDKHVIVKKLFEPEDILNNFLETFETFFSGDLRTSAWYGHKKASVNQIRGAELLIKQYQYLTKSCYDYNLENCLLEFDLKDNPILVYNFIDGENFLESSMGPKIDSFIQMIPSLLTAVSRYPHGDLSFTNLILQKGQNKFSIIDPAVHVNNVFFTNTEFYPIAPPFFCETDHGYSSYSDQLAIGLMLYRLITKINPLENMTASPFWTKEHGFGNPIGGVVPDDIYSVISIFPWFQSASFNFNEYLSAIKNQLKIQNKTITNRNDFIHAIGIDTYKTDFPTEFFSISPPKQINNLISSEISDLCTDLIFRYEPIRFYIDRIRQLEF
jgi:hypothetical protein